MFGKRPVQVDHTDIPTAVFSQPEVGTVGLTEAEARAQFSHVDIYKATFRPMKATMSGRDTRMLMKLVVDGTTDRVVGCHIVGDGAAEMVQVVGDRRQDEGDQGRFRRHLGAAPDRGGRTRDDADADRAVCAGRGGGVAGGEAAGWGCALAKPSLRCAWCGEAMGIAKGSTHPTHLHAYPCNVSYLPPR